MLDNFTLYWLTNTAASAARIYCENRGRDLISAAAQKTDEISVPVANRAPCPLSKGQREEMRAMLKSALVPLLSGLLLSAAANADVRVPPFFPSLPPTASLAPEVASDLSKKGYHVAEINRSGTYPITDGGSQFSWRSSRVRPVSLGGFKGDQRQFARQRQATASRYNHDGKNGDVPDSEKARQDGGPS